MWFFAIFAVTFIALLFIKPPQQPGMTAGEVDRPKVELGEEPGVVLGSHWIEDSQCLWYGDIRTVAIKAKGGKK